MKICIRLVLLLLAATATAQENSNFTITANLIAETDSAMSQFNAYLEAAGPLMIEEGLEVVLLDVTNVKGRDGPLRKGDIVAFTRSPPGALQRLFSREDFQAIVPMLQTSLRGHRGMSIDGASPEPGWFEAGVDYVVEWADGSAGNQGVCEASAAWKLLSAQDGSAKVERVALYRGHKATSCRMSTTLSGNGYAAQMRLKTIIAE